MRPGTPDNGQAAKRDSLWVLDMVEQPPAAGGRRQTPVPPITPRWRRAMGVERMEQGNRRTVDDAVNDVSELLARAYLRHSRVRTTQAAEDALRSTECLDNTGQTSPHGLTLTGQRGHGKESTQE